MRCTGRRGSPLMNWIPCGQRLPAGGGEMVEVMMSNPVESRMRMWAPSGMGLPNESLPSMCRAGRTFIRIGSAGRVMDAAGWLLQVAYAASFAPPPLEASAMNVNAAFGENAIALAGAA